MKSLYEYYEKDWVLNPQVALGSRWRILSRGIPCSDLQFRKVTLDSFVKERWKSGWRQASGGVILRTQVGTDEGLTQAGCNKEWRRENHT